MGLPGCFAASQNHRILKYMKQTYTKLSSRLSTDVNKEIKHTYLTYVINPLNPVLVLVPSSLSRQQSGHGTSTNTIFINFLKKKYWEYWLQVCTIRPVHVSSFSENDLILSNAYTCVVASVIKLLRHS